MLVIHLSAQVGESDGGRRAGGTVGRALTRVCRPSRLPKASESARCLPGPTQSVEHRDSNVNGLGVLRALYAAHRKPTAGPAGRGPTRRRREAAGFGGRCGSAPPRTVTPADPCWASRQTRRGALSRWAAGERPWERGRRVVAGKTKAGGAVGDVMARGVSLGRTRLRPLAPVRVAGAVQARQAELIGPAHGRPSTPSAERKNVGCFRRMFQVSIGSDRRGAPSQCTAASLKCLAREIEKP